MLRAAKQYYDSRLEESFEVKKMRRKISRSSVLRHEDQPSFLQISDELTALIFNEEQFGYLSIFRLSNEQLSNHIASLINNKPLKHEIQAIPHLEKPRQVRL